MIRFMAVMVPAVFLINGLSKHNWLEAFLFAMAVAVGLTPEMLPMIVTVNLSKGALAMARKKVIVKRLNAIQNFGAMDVLCTDKTGTITQGKIVLEKHLDVHGDPSEKVLHYGYLNSYHHTGLKNLLDEAILDHEELEERLKANEKYRKIDEIPFDFVRRRMSVVVEDETGLNTLICKGAVEEVMSLCTRVEVNGEVLAVQPEHDAHRRQMVDDLNGQGFRVIALAYKEMPGAPDEPVYAVKDESDLILLGFLAFLDPPKETAAEALKQLHSLNVDVKILTGDNEIITAYICKEVGLPVEHDPARLSDRGAERGGTGRSRQQRPASLPGWPRPTRSASSTRFRARVTSWASWATASTTPRPSRPPMWASRWTARWTSPRSRPTSSCWRTAC